MEQELGREGGRPGGWGGEVVHERACEKALGYKEGTMSHSVRPEQGGELRVSEGQDGPAFVRC